MAWYNPKTWGKPKQNVYEYLSGGKYSAPLTPGQSKAVDAAQVQRETEMAARNVAGGSAAGAYNEAQRAGLSQAQADAAYQAELQRQARLEAQRVEAQRLTEQQAQQQKQADIQQQTIITSKTQTLSSGGTPLRDVEFGIKYAEYQRQLQEEAREKRRRRTILY